MHNDGLTISTRQLFKLFPNQDKARKYLEDKRWKDGVVCPHCGEKHRVQKRKAEGYYRCLACVKDFTVRTKTIFERSHVGLDLWIYAIYLIITNRKGISSLQLSKELGVTQKTAWFMLQRIRSALIDHKDDDDEDDQNGFLRGIVEADETFVGGRETNKHANKKLRAGRGTVGKMIVAGVKEREGRVKASVIPNTSSPVIKGFVRENVLAGTVLCTDEHASYVGMNEYSHHIVCHSAKQFVDGMAYTNSIESVWAVLKRGFYGTYHFFSSKHLQRYVNEFTFRLNEGNCRIHILERMDALLDKAFRVRVDYKTLTA